MTVEVRRSTAAETAPLRQRVLRPHESLPLDGDGDPTAVHLAGLRDGEVVGSANVRPEPAPFPVEGTAWRLRGMATADGGRSADVGAAVLDAAVAEVLAGGGDVLWCNARTPAQRFYEREGFATVGEPWEDPAIGPHVRMVRRLRPAGPTASSP